MHNEAIWAGEVPRRQLQSMSQRKATLLVLSANSSELGPFLAGAVDTVSATEPGTVDWVAVDDSTSPESYAIFDIFASEAARQAHFDGKVAAALTERADELLSPERAAGTLGLASHFEVLSEVPARDAQPRLFTRIDLRAAAGQADALAVFLGNAASVVAENEPGTLRWFALRSESEPDRFAIVDWFADESGRSAHFGGPVAAALRENADLLVEGGWPAVLEGVEHGTVLGSLSR